MSSNEIKNKIEITRVVVLLADNAELHEKLRLVENHIVISVADLLPITPANRAEYQRRIFTGGFQSKLEAIINDCEKFMTGRNKTKFKDLKENFKKNNCVNILKKADIESCQLCGDVLNVDCMKSELQCSNVDCLAIYELNGTVFDESQMYCQDGQKAKSGTFNPNRHFQQWWQHILAREPDDEIGDKADPKNLLGEKLIEDCRKIVKRDNLVLQLLTVNQVRQMLQELEKTNFNKNVPLIMKRLTGIGPPQLPDELSIRVENLFTKAIEIEELIRPSSRTNRNYYSYYIYKILDYLIPESAYEMRRVLYYIYMQSKETVETDDIEWAKICAELKEIPYKPTDRNLAQKYKPI
jgi:hypothetical protein